MNTELHRHLDVSTRLTTLLELAQERGLEAKSTSLEAFRKKLVMTQPMSDLNTVLAQFTLFQKILDRPEVLERVAYEVVEDCWKEGTNRAELRFSPSFVTEYAPHLSWDDILSAYERGMKRALAKYPEMKAGLICISVRHYGPEDVDRVVDFYLKNQSRFIALDLAGNESDYPCKLFESSFKKAIAAGSRITIHSGEDSDPDNVWDAIYLLGAQRIGHGIRSIKDTKLVDYLREHKICLEMCPTSNWLTRAVPSFEEHPLPKMLRMGVPVSINTDDPTIFGTNLPQEIEIARTQMGLTRDELELCQKYARDASFIF